MPANGETATIPVVPKVTIEMAKSLLPKRKSSDVDGMNILFSILSAYFLMQQDVQLKMSHKTDVHVPACAVMCEIESSFKCESFLAACLSESLNF